MLMKVLDEGQVAIPASIRKKLRLEAGDLLDVTSDEENNSIVLRRNERSRPEELASSLSQCAEGKKSPSRRAMQDALREGLLGGQTSD